MRIAKEQILRLVLKVLNANPFSFRFMVEPKTALSESTETETGRPPRAIFVAERDYFADGLFTVHGHEFQELTPFKEAYSRAVEATGRDYEIPWRTHVAIWAATTALQMDGDFVELGTGRGWMFSAILQATDWSNQKANLYLFDRFMPHPVDPITGEQIFGEEFSDVYANTYDDVVENFNEWDRVTIVRGALPMTLSEIETSLISFLHVDLNAVEPEIESLRYLWRRIADGGIILLDDYNYAGYELQHAAMNELSLELNFNILSLPTGQGLIIKGNTNQHQESRFSKKRGTQ